MAGCSEETLVARLRSLCLVWVNEGQNKSRCSRVPGDFAEAQAGRRQIPSLFSVQCLWSLLVGSPSGQHTCCNDSFVALIRVGTAGSPDRMRFG